MSSASSSTGASRSGDTYRLVVGPPPLEDYLRLRRDSGLSPKDPAQGAGAISGSWSACHVVDQDGVPVAMGRTIGDGGWYFHIADIATDPAHQRQGLGRRVVQWLLDDIRSRAPHGAYVTLVGDPPASGSTGRSGSRTSGRAWGWRWSCAT